MQIFLDCDGVLADFDSHFARIAGESAHGYEDKHGSKAFWKVVMSDESFFVNLPVMPDAKELVAAVKHLNPIILTGCPQGNWSQPQKQLWRRIHFPDLPMITCESRNKYHYMVPAAHNIIIDDLVKYKTIWEENGGTFILHTSAQDSIKQLKELGVNV
jgi:5'(3')-deoxyribonucleotidase